MRNSEADLNARIARLERRLRLALIAAMLSSAVGTAAVIGSLATRAEAAPAAGQSTPIVDVLRVRELDVVDKNGVTRLKLAAPLPAPIIDGQMKKTRGGNPGDTMSGILLFGADGAERSGYATVDSGYSNVLLTLDDERSRQHAMFIAEPNGATTLRLFNGDTKDRVDVGINNNGPYIAMTRRGKEIFRRPAH